MLNKYFTIYSFLYNACTTSYFLYTALAFPRCMICWMFIMFTLYQVTLPLQVHPPSLNLPLDPRPEMFPRIWPIPDPRVRALVSTAGDLPWLLFIDMSWYENCHISIIMHSQDFSLFLVSKQFYSVKDYYLFQNNLIQGEVLVLPLFFFLKEWNTNFLFNNCSCGEYS